MSEAPKTVITMTITGIPFNLNDQLLHADAVITVDFGEIAAECIGAAAFSKRKIATRMDSAIIVKAINVRAQR